jgi:tRNA pseudouridine55 synthase
MPETLCGFLVLDKPEGITSHDVVARLRRILRLRQIGHLGTLDPLATGVLPLAIGKATRLIQYVTSNPKIYSGTIRWGIATTTYDREGIPTFECAEPLPRWEEIKTGASFFFGDQSQLPPPFSAKKVGGRPAHRLARKGEAFTLKPQHIRIDRFDLTPRTLEEADFEIQCSPGTYIRSIVHDLGQRLGCGAHLTRLRRSASGFFHLSQAIPFTQWEELASEHFFQAAMIPAHFALGHIPSIHVDAGMALMLKQGRSLRGDEFVWSGDNLNGLVRLVSDEGVLIGLAEVFQESSLLRPCWTIQPRLILI